MSHLHIAQVLPQSVLGAGLGMVSEHLQPRHERSLQGGDSVRTRLALVCAVTCSLQLFKGFYLGFRFRV